VLWREAKRIGVDFLSLRELLARKRGQLGTLRRGDRSSSRSPAMSRSPPSIVAVIISL
jgi:hypothetical protein